MNAVLIRVLVVTALCSLLASCEEPAASDAGTTSPDAGMSSPDAGTSSPDAGTSSPDAGTSSPDAGTSSPDAGTTSPDAGTSSPDAGLCDGTGLAPSPASTGGPQPLCLGGRVLSGFGAREGIERYACLFAPPLVDDATELPLVVFLPGTGQSADSVAGFGLIESVATANIGARLGMRVLIPQPVTLSTPLGETYAFDAVDTDTQANADLLALEDLLDTAAATVSIEPGRVHLIGWSGGAYFAGFFALARPSRVASFAQYAGGSFFGYAGCPPLQQPITERVPGFVIYRDCDALVPCDDVEQWIDRLQAGGYTSGELQTLRLNGLGFPADQCAASCDVNVGTANHLSWPTERMLDVFTFFREHPQAS